MTERDEGCDEIKQGCVVESDAYPLVGASELGSDPVIDKIPGCKDQKFTLKQT